MSTTAHAISKLLALSDSARPHSQAVTHGTFAAFFTGDRNQHGEPYGTQLLDAQIGGGGASAFSDGIDQSGCFVAPKPHIANVESNEIHGPMLFLYRSFFPGTGGDGEYRGGLAAGTAWMPHGVDHLSRLAHVPRCRGTGVFRTVRWVARSVQHGNDHSRHPRTRALGAREVAPHLAVWSRADRPRATGRRGADPRGQAGRDPALPRRRRPVHVAGRRWVRRPAQP